MCKISEQIFKSQVTRIMSIVFFSCFLLKLRFLCLLFILFLILNVDFTVYFYILVLYSVFGKHKLGSSIIEPIGKTAFTAEFLTAANTLAGEVKFLTSFLIFFLKCHKDIENPPSYFVYAWPNPSKIILSMCKRLSCLSACKTSTS